MIDGIEITPEHRAAIDFSTPYYRTAERIAVRRDAVGLDSIAALRGHIVGTLKDTLSQRLLEQAGGIVPCGPTTTRPTPTPTWPTAAWTR